MRDGDDITLEQLLDRFGDALKEELHVALPGRVVSYDAAQQRADVEPMVKRSLERSDGTRVPELLPTIRSVPVCWPRAGEWFFHMPLEPGHTVLLVFLERDPARWLQTGEISDPLDVRQHHLAHAIAIPGIYPRPAPMVDTPTNKLVLGRQHSGPGEPAFQPLTVRIGHFDIKLGNESASDFVALSSLVIAALTFLKDAIGAADATTAASFKAALVAALATWPSSVAATKVKAL